MEADTMKTFDKSSKLDNVLYDVRGPVVDEAARMEADGLSILKLNIGNPAPFGFNAPDYRYSGYETVIVGMSGIFRFQGTVFRKKSNHAVLSVKENSGCDDGRYLYR